MNAPTIGIPYAHTIFDKGRIGHVCPRCEKVFYGPTTGSEDDVTKGGARAYAKHWQEKHSLDGGSR